MSCAKDNDVAVISTPVGDMVVELYPEVAPYHVENFQILANEGYFDGTTFHRVVPGFMMVQEAGQENISALVVKMILIHGWFLLSLMILSM